MKIAICMAYYNRLALLKNTLYTISCKTHPDEIIIVDDASDKEPLTSDIIRDISCGLSIKVYRFSKKDKTWFNPCVAYNKAFSLVSEDTDVIIIQNPECAHRDDIVGECKKLNFTNNYYVFGCYCLPKNADYKTHKFNNRGIYHFGDDAWCQHSLYRSSFYHFTSAISKEDLYKLRGFDENYADGASYDDDEFLYRVRRICDVYPIDDKITLHQYHESSGANVQNLQAKVTMNREKFISLTKGTYKDFKSSLGV